MKEIGETDFGNLLLYSPLITWRKTLEKEANQWTGFYMITAPVMKELNSCKISRKLSIKESVK